MKKNTLQKVLATALVSTMAMGALTACGGEAAPEASAPASSESSAAAESTPAESTPAETVAGIEGFVPFESTVTLQIPVYQRATPNGAADAGDNYWTNWVQENFGDKYNIDVEYITLDRGQENEQYALLAAAGKLPVCCFEYDYPDVTLYQNEGYLQEYDIDWFKQIAPTYWQRMVDNGLDAYTEINGENVLLVGSRAYGNTNYQFTTFYRQDWVEAAGFTEYPSDPDELMKLYAKIAELGLGSEHFLGGTKIEGNGADQNYPYRTYPLDELTWATTGDYVIPALSTEAQKALLKKQNELYNLGYIDPEYNTRTSDFAVSDFVSGQVFTYSCYSTAKNDVLDQFYAANPDAHLGIVVNPGPMTFADGTCTAYRPNGDCGQYIGFSSQASEEQMKAFAMYLEWMCQDDVFFTLKYGLEGINFNYDADGNPVYVEDQTGLAEQQGHNNNVDMWCLVEASAAATGDAEKDIKSCAPVGYPDSDKFAEQIWANYQGQLACFEAGMVAPDCKFGVTIAASDEYKDTLFAKYAELRDKIVMGSVDDFEANYEAASKEYLAAGYQAIIDEKAEAYNSGATTHLR